MNIEQAIFILFVGFTCIDYWKEKYKSRKKNR